jgi:hypothetical protein
LYLGYVRNFSISRKEGDIIFRSLNESEKHIFLRFLEIEHG